MTETLSFWNQQFQFSKILPDFADHLALLDDQSTQWITENPTTRISYGDDPRQWIEMADGKGDGTIIPFFIHGGYWRALTAESHRSCLKGLSSLGPKIFNAEYRLMPGTSIDLVMQDILDAVTCAMGQLEENQQLLIIGHSAGGHLATHAALHHNDSAKIAGLVSLSGLFDATPVQFSFLQAELALDKLALEHIDLMSAAKRLAVPALMVVGETESYEFQRQSQLFADLSGAAITRVENAHHMSLLQSLHIEDSALIQAIAAVPHNNQPDPVIKGVS